MQINRRWTNCNEYDCISYSLTIPFKKTLVYKTKYHYKATPTEENKHKNIILKKIPQNEKILDFMAFPNGCHEMEYEILTKPIATIQREKNIQETLKKHGYPQDDWMPITINEHNWIRLNDIPLTEEDITKVKKILNGETWRIQTTRDDGSFLKIKLREK